ncbi:DUF4142 domain-containing protein [Anaeromyxobacter terrae]|uniref:DUF4142 domain-containing protein n=1 Tax=Anaeromyxobacter terrae TaxID=2925406 RepID=UPI001F563C42|nr:DUF4142 domain-containing protein [Anaeromyxobacter sp. SG22]
MDIRWRGAAIAAALLVGAPAYGQGAGSQMGTGGQRSPGDDSTRSTTSEKGTGMTREQGATGSRGSTSSTMGTGSAATAPGGKELKKDLVKAVQELHAANQTEVQLGQLGTQSAQSPDVKQYAEKLAKDHQKNDDQLQQLAQTLGVNLQGEEAQEKMKEGQEKMTDLQKKQGAEFDKAFMKAMVKDHKKDVKDVEKAAKEARKENQTQLASFFETTHTGLQGHLQEAQRIEKQLEHGGSQARQGARPGETMGTGSGAAGKGGGTGGTGGGTGTGGTETGTQQGAGGSGGGTGGPSGGGK